MRIHSAVQLLTKKFVAFLADFATTPATPSCGVFGADSVAMCCFLGTACLKPPASGVEQPLFFC